MWGEGVHACRVLVRDPSPCFFCGVACIVRILIDRFVGVLSNSSPSCEGSCSPMCLADLRRFLLLATRGVSLRDRGPWKASPLASPARRGGSPSHHVLVEAVSRAAAPSLSDTVGSFPKCSNDGASLSVERAHEPATIGPFAAARPCALAEDLHRPCCIVPSGRSDHGVQ